MRNGVIFRIALWASAGFLVSAGWGLYFASANKANPVEPIVYALFRLTQPVAAVTVSYFDFPRGLTWIVVENAATYALVSLAAQMLGISRKSRYKKLVDYGIQAH